MLDDAAANGLRVANYRWCILSPANLPANPAAEDPATRARLDVALSAAAMRYMKDLHEGRFNPEQLGLNPNTSYRRINLDQELARVQSSSAIRETLESYAPRIPLFNGRPIYDQLQEALAEYREQAAVEER